MNEKLLPCPFCGGEARIMLEEEDRPDECFHNIYCTSCGVQFWVKSKSEAIAAWNRRAQPENEPCADCTGIMYRQTASGKIIPADSKCPAAVPTCYQPDGDGCAYQIYGDNNDEPIDRCKECPLCYADKARRKQPGNEPLTLDELRKMDGEPVWTVTNGVEGSGRWEILESVDNEFMRHERRPRHDQPNHRSAGAVR